MKEPKHSYKDHEQLASILCYFIIGIIWFFADKEMHKSKLVKFHSKQMINISVFNVSISILGIMLPIVGENLLYVGGLVILVLWVLGIINAVNEKTKPIPLIGEIAEKYLTY